MATSLLFGACSGDGKTCDRATQQKGNTENVIGRSDIKVKDGRMTPEVLGEINEMIVRDAKERQAREAKSKDDDDDSDGQPGTGGNSGTMIVDATCAPSNIRYPQDVSLLNEARENAETLLDVLHDPAGGKASNLPQTRPERLPEIHKMP